MSTSQPVKKSRKQEKDNDDAEEERVFVPMTRIPAAKAKQILKGECGGKNPKYYNIWMSKDCPKCYQVQYSDLAKEKFAFARTGYDNWLHKKKEEEKKKKKEKKTNNKKK